MRSFPLAIVVLFAVSACKRDEAAPAPTPSPSPSPAPTVVETTAPPPSASATATATAVAVDAGIDTSKWETKDLDALGTAKFPFAGTVMFPKGTKTRTSVSSVGGKSGGTFAFLDLPDGTEVMLDERSAASTKDSAMTKQLIGQTSGGTLIADQNDATGWFFAFQTSDGVLVQGATWTVPPGLGCATQKAITSTKLDEVRAICTSLRPKPKK